MLVAIAGSTQHMMQGLALDETSPLYGRAVAAFALPPMAPSALGQALALGDARRVVAAYTVWGGVPSYWELAEPFDDVVDEAVDRLVLDPMGPLHTEGDRLLLEERPPAVSLRPLLEAIGNGAHRVSEIAGRLGVAATALGRPLARLVDLGLVTREQPFADTERSGKRTRYRIADPFLRLWFRVVAPHRALLAAADRESRLTVWNRHRPGLNAAAWEELCRRAVPALSRSGDPLARFGPFGPAARFWRGSGPEWDVVSRSLDGATLLLGEAKWSERVVGETELQRTGAALVARGPTCPGRPIPGARGPRDLRAGTDRHPYGGGALVHHDRRGGCRGRRVRLISAGLPFGEPLPGRQLRQQALEQIVAARGHANQQRDIPALRRPQYVAVVATPARGGTRRDISRRSDLAALGEPLFEPPGAAA